MRINQSGVLPTQPSNPHIRENRPQMLPRSPLGLPRSLSTLIPLLLSFSLDSDTQLGGQRCVPFITDGEKSARHRPYPNSDDFVRRLSTISPLSARRQEEAVPHRFRNETRSAHPFGTFALSGSCLE